FQIVLALSYQYGRVAGMILLVSFVCGATLLAVLCGTIRGPSTWIGALVWLPALLLMSKRFQPRPEVFSLLFAAAYLATLDACDRRPASAWLLPPLQILWVNTHGLFVLGPIMMAAYCADSVFLTGGGRHASTRQRVLTGKTRSRSVGTAFA